MLEARKVGVWSNRYDIFADKQPLTTWDGSTWRQRGSFELAGQRYDVTGNSWGTKYHMVDPLGTEVASANRVGRKDWTVEADGRTYTFQRASMWRNEEELHADGQRLGSIKRTSFFRRDAVADLPGLPLPVQVFVFAVVLTKWDQQTAAAS